MSIASRINEIGVHLTKDWKSIEALTGTATVDKNIENIASVLNDLYDDLPKSTGEDTSLSLSTRAGKMEIDLLGNTSQTGTPTPSTPIDVNVVSGDNEVVVCGKNLVYEWHRAVNLYYLNETTGYANYVFKAGTYTLSYKNNSGSNIGCYLQDSTGTQQSLGNDTTITFTSSKDFNIWFYRSGMQDGDISEVQLELGSATPYEPYQSQTYEVDLRTSKNLLSLDEIIRGIELNSDNGQTMVNANWWTSDYIVVKPNTSYTSSGVSSNTKCWYDKNKAFISMKKSTTATSPNNAKYLRVNGTIATLGDNLQIEVGSTATSYEPYSSIELCKISTYQDRFIKTTGKNKLKPPSNQTITFSSRTITITDNYFDITGSGGGVSPYISLGEAYTIQANDYIHFYNNQDTFNVLLYSADSDTQIAELSLNSANKIVDLSSYAGQTISRIKIYINGSTQGAKLFNFRPMIINGVSTSTPYEPYGTGQWCKYNAIGKVVLDGSETAWAYINSTFRINVPGLILSNYDMVKQVSNYYQGITYNSSWASYNYFICYTTDSNFVIKNIDITSLDDFKTWLGTHNTTVYYVLATPYLSLIEDNNLIEQLDNLQNAMSYSGTTNINQVNNDLPFIMSASALKGE